MHNPETLAAWSHTTQDEDKHHQLNVREYRKDNQKWTIQRHWQHRTHKTQDEDKEHQIKARAYQRGHQKYLIQRHWQNGHTRHRTKTNNIKLTLEKTEVLGGAIKNGQSRETDNI